MAETKHYDLVIIGSGPGGYVGAIRAAQMGLKVCCIERGKLGGVCLNWGCIPTKALLHNAELYMEAIRHGKDWGFEFAEGAVKVDWAKVIGRSRAITGTLNNGIAFLLKKNKIDHVEGHAKILNGKTASGPCRVQVTKADGDYYRGTGGGEKVGEITADRIMICTGAAPNELPCAKCDGKTVLSSYDALSIPKQPKSIVIIGSGAIGMEFAYFFNAFATKVTVVEMLDRILPQEDEEISAAALRAFTKQGMEFRVATVATAIDKTTLKDGSTGAKVTLAQIADKTKTEVIEAECVIVAIGVKARYEGLFDEKLGLKIEKNHIWTDYKDKKEPTYQTSVPGIYATGDCIGPPWLAHIASEEAVACVERFMGHHTLGVDYSSIPGCTYCSPQIASVGMTEKQVKEKGLKYKVGKYSFKGHGKAIAVGATEGLVKIIVSEPYGEILGAHIIGEDASELIGEMGLARRVEATIEDVISTVHAHPTMHEALHEAALATEGRAIHA